MAEVEVKYLFQAIVAPCDPELICSICLELLYHPVECPCQHIYCKRCIERWLFDHNSCPQCGQEASTTSLVKASAAVTDQIFNLEAKCMACRQAIGRLKHLEMHTNTCPDRIIQCENDFCGAILHLKNKARHDAKCKLCMMRAKLSKHKCHIEKMEQLLESEKCVMIKLCAENEPEQSQDTSSEHSELLLLAQAQLKEIAVIKGHLRNLKVTETKIKQLIKCLIRDKINAAS